jgi:acyl-CoA synthetase (AMP-forming)/AMP-acid ligase II
VITLLTDHLRAMAGTFGDKVGYRVIDVGEMTFAQWEAESNRLARGLVERGVSKGDRVALYLRMEEALRFMVAYAAVHKAGAVAVPTNIRLTEPELERLLGHAEVTALLTDSALAPSAERVVATLPTVKHLVTAPKDSGQPWSWGDAGTNDASEFQVAVSGEDLADILYTSGTTGLPKGVAIRHRNVALIPGAPHPSYSGHSWLHSSPLFTFAGIGFIYNPMQLGLFGVFQPKFDAGRWIEIVGELRPQFVFLVPAMAQLIVTHERFASAALDSIQICAVGSSPLAPSTLRALQERMPEASVSNSYGMTEAGPAFCSMPKGEALKRIGSVGQPMPPLEVRIVDDAGRDVADGEIGEAVLRMEGRQREYYRNPEATAGAWKDGWLYSGDLARMDADGYLYIVGRKKDVIIRGGNNVHAVDIEAVLLDHLGVIEAGVVGIPHEVLGEDVAAVVVRAGGSTVTADELRAHCAERLADYKVPRRIEFSDELPRNATGKILKEKLKETLGVMPAPG